MNTDYTSGPRPRLNHDTAPMTLACFAARARTHINTYVRLLRQYTGPHTMAEWQRLAEAR